MKKRVNKRTILAKFKPVLAYIFSLPLYWISFLVSRRKNIWVFGAWFGLRYGDNPRYLFEYAQKQNDIKAIWITRDRKIVSQIRALGYPAFLRYSLWGIYYMLRASVAIVGSGLADLNRALIYRAFKLNLWHGAPMKKLNYGNETAETGGFAKGCLGKFIDSIILYARDMKVYQLVLATSDYFKPIMASGFEISCDNVKVLGYPRNDVLFDVDHHFEYMENLKAKFKCAKILAYLPTYRDTYEQNVDLFSKYGFDGEAMETFLEETQSILLVKLHYADQLKMKGKQFNLGPRIIYADEKEVPDINDILRYIDVLITDYSGVYFDYLLLNRPVVFAAFDLEEYIRQRGLYNDYNFYISGLIARNWSEVIDHAREAIRNPKKYEDVRAEKNRIFNNFNDGNSSMRIYEYLRANILKKH